MRERTCIVVRFGIGCELATTPGLCPAFRCPGERAPDASPTDTRTDVPAFQVADAICVAALCVGANRDFRESDKPAETVFGDQHRDRLAGATSKEAPSLGVVFGPIARASRSPESIPK
jgi:hypothetical protein